MTKQNREALDAYYHEGESWASDRTAGLRTSCRTAWRVAAGAALVAIGESVALVALTPLKTVVPYTLLVDRTTGYVEALNPLDANTIAPDKALTQSFLVQYVLARESFDADQLQANYQKTLAWSVDLAKREYIAQVQASNPQSPLASLPRSTVIETRVKSISPLGAGSVLVRFDTQRRDANGRVQPSRAWVSVVRYRFSGEPLQRSDRFVNPLGFQVLRYRRDAENLAPMEATPQPAASDTPESARQATPIDGAATVVPPGVQQ